MATVTMPDGKTYDLSTYEGRQAARDANPAYVVTGDGYLLRGSGGEVSQDPSRGGRGPQPLIQGGAGTGSPNGYPSTLPPVTVSASALAQVQAAAAAGTIPSGPGGSYIFQLAQLVSGGISLTEAVHRVQAAASGAAADLSAGASGLLGGSNNPSGGALAPGLGGAAPAGSSRTLLYAGLGIGLFLLLRKH